MAKLPMRITPDVNYAFYLHWRGAVGSEAICYLPAFNDWIRRYYERKGFKLLNICQGDYSMQGENALVISPPNDDTIHALLEELRARVAGELKALDVQIADVERRLKLATGSMAEVYHEKLGHLKANRERLANDQPTFQQAKHFFYRVHHGQLRQAVPAQVREWLARSVEEQRWAQAVEQTGRQPDDGGQPE